MTINLQNPVFQRSIVGPGGINQALVDVMNSSTEFQRIFVELEGSKVVIRLPREGESGTFFSAASNPPSIVIFAVDFQIFRNNPELLVARIGHEIAHALDFIHSPALTGADGLTGSSPGPSNSNPSDYTNSRSRDEGIAVTEEYFIARDLGLRSVSLGDAVYSRLNKVFESMALAGRSG